MQATVIETQHTVRIGEDFITISFMIEQNFTQVFVNDELVISTNQQHKLLQVSYLNIINMAVTYWGHYCNERNKKSIEQLKEYISMNQA